MSVFLSTRDLGEKVNRTAKQSFQAASGISMAQSFLGVELGPETFLCESVPSPVFPLYPFFSAALTPADPASFQAPELFIPSSPPGQSFRHRGGLSD